jgi:hypothetical protein
VNPSPVCFHCHRPKDPAAYIAQLHVCQACARLLQDEYDIPLQSIPFADQFHRSGAWFRSKSERLSAYTPRLQVRLLLLVANQAVNGVLEHERETAGHLGAVFPELVAMTAAAPLSIQAPPIPLPAVGPLRFDPKMAAAGKD